MSHELVSYARGNAAKLLRSGRRIEAAQIADLANCIESQLAEIEQKAVQLLTKQERDYAVGDILSFVQTYRGVAKEFAESGRKRLAASYRRRATILRNAADKINAMPVDTNGAKSCKP